MAFEKSDDIKRVLTELINRINEDRRRIRLIEQNMDRVESSISALENNVLTRMGELKIALERINNKLTENTNRINTLESEIAKLGRMIKKTASKAELKHIESFIDVVNPITSKFVTKDELDRALDDMEKKKLRA